MTRHCRTGCPTQNHTSYAACCRGLQLNSGEDRTFKQRAWDAELQAYRNAVSEGIQPDGTSMAKIDAAKKKSDAVGVAYGG